MKAALSLFFIFAADWGHCTLSSHTSEDAAQMLATPHFYFGNLTFTPNNVEPAIASEVIGRPFSVSCGSGFEPESSPLPIEDRWQTSAESDEEGGCEALYERAAEMVMSKQYQMAYDTGRHYIETCANTPRSFRGFSLLRGPVQFRSDSPDRWYELRDWVKKVLFLNTTDPYYYCAGVNLLFMSFQHYDPEKGEDKNGMIALLDYIVSSGRCPEDTAGYLHDRRRTRELQYENWADTVKDSIATPLDTGAVTLEDIGLEWVRGQSHVDLAPAQSGQGLLSFRVSENPYRRETTLEYEVDMDMRVRIEIFCARPTTAWR